MTLGDLIEILEKLPDDTWVVYDDGTDAPDYFASWRGAYRDLTLCPGQYEIKAPHLLRQAKDAVGATFQGWKGGDFVMDTSTPVYADEEGRYTRRIIVDSTYEPEFSRLRLNTITIPWEY